MAADAASVYGDGCRFNVGASRGPASSCSPLTGGVVLPWLPPGGQQGVETARCQQPPEGGTILKDCRECGQPVAARAKTCPGCGVKKPTATKAEAGLDAVAAGAMGIFWLIVLIVMLIFGIGACIAAIA